MRSLIATYTPPSLSPEWRLRDFISQEKRLTWMGLLLDEFPRGELFVVGGTVRDVLIGRFPKDIDLLVRGIEPEKLESWLQRNGAAEFVGRFGTFKFIPHGQAGIEPIDIALPRTEYMRDGHNGGRRDMDVHFDYMLDIETDLSRRDFTINAIAFNVKTNRVVDPFHGLRDLKYKLINAVLRPENRFLEDATRILRGLRFASQLHFGIEENTWKALKDNVHLLENTFRDDEGRAVYAVAREAIGKEFLLGFLEHPVHTVHLWAEAGVMHLYMPELLALEGNDEREVEARERTEDILHLLHKKSFLKEYSKRKPSLTAMLGGLFAFTDIESGDAKKICVKLYFHQFSENNRAYVDCDKLYWLLENLFLFEDNSPAMMRPSEFERMFMNDKGEDLLLLMQAYYTARGIHSPARERVLQAKRMRSKMLDLYMVAGGGEKLPKLLAGSDLKQLGIEPGPEFRVIFEDLRDKQLLGEIVEKGEAENYIRRKYVKG